MKYTEIFKLKEMLEKANIPFVYKDESWDRPILNEDWNKIIQTTKWYHYHIYYPTKGERRICSIIQGDGSYGREQDLLEIMGLLTKKEEKHNSVAGYLTAEDVFNRIQKHYKKSKKESK